MGYTLITGGSGGIGFHLAREFAKNNHDIILVSSNLPRLETAKKKLEKEFSSKVYIFDQDLSILGSAEDLYDKIETNDLYVDILVNNAGFGLLGRTEKIDLQQDEKLMVLNMISLVTLCKLFLGNMYKNKKGKILNISSVVAFYPSPFTATYAASKSFVLSYSKAIRHEAEQYGVRVSTLCPGSTKTAFFEREGAITPSYAVSAEIVASYAYKQFMKNKSVIVPGFKFRAMRILPSAIKTTFMGNLLSKYE